ncbi:(Fe-S)-binding protein [Flavihumibacter petaseus]|uniref:Lactate utilization protein A n=1 Tax=Flavihumibacter petaseus NBRC 106054 TaxID=1220578 RepID=A0A0E9MY32_9BACT|nr:(Fe-S)-binding protein [Flavihumibacter petaseus]GAO42489.1 lactate utilization protein A [Flavihumibacter petaseus NBRC 106054]
MKVGLFIPCYIDQFYPQVAVATLELLERLGCEVHYPLQQTCCGQPMANSGFSHLSQGCDNNFFRNFEGYDYIVCPSGSCTLHVKEHFQQPGNEQAAVHLRNSVYELTEFLTDVLQVTSLEAEYRHRVGLHVSCHGQRGLHLSSMTETMTPAYSKPERLLSLVDGLELVYPDRPDECCGFGGTFCVFEEAVSAKMGKDRIREHEEKDVEVITAVDMSCLMHLEGILKRNGSKVQVKHIAEILNSPSS